MNGMSHLMVSTHLVPTHLMVSTHLVPTHLVVSAHLVSTTEIVVPTASTAPAMTAVASLGSARQSNQTGKGEEQEEASHD